MKKLAKSNSSLETVVQAVLYRIYKENSSAIEVIDSIDENTWKEIESLVEKTDSRALFEYIVRKEYIIGEKEDKVIEYDSKVEMDKLKIWMMRIGFKFSLVSITILLTTLIIVSPESLAPVLNNLISVLGRSQV